MFWFLELEEELGLFGQNHFYVSFALPNSGGVLLDPTFSSSGVSSLRSCRFCFAKSLSLALATSFSSAGMSFLALMLALFRKLEIWDSTAGHGFPSRSEASY